MCNSLGILLLVIKSIERSENDKSDATIHIKVHVRFIEMFCDFAVLKQITLEGIAISKLSILLRCFGMKMYDTKRKIIHCNITHVSVQKELRSGSREFLESNFRFRFFLKSKGFRADDQADEINFARKSCITLIIICCCCCIVLF
jgi:hypothetical protein